MGVDTMSDITYTSRSWLTRCKERMLLASPQQQKRAFTILLIGLICISMLWMGIKHISAIYCTQQQERLHSTQLEEARQRLNQQSKQPLNDEEGSTPANVEKREETEKTEKICIHVAGAVKQPGLVYLDASARVHDAIQAAGGGVDTANLSQINLAAHLKDGMRIYIPQEGENASASTSPQSPSGESSAQETVVEINSADVAALTAIPGIGEKTAQKIVDERTAHGKFSGLEDLRRVAGIGDKKLESIRPYVTIAP